MKIDCEISDYAVKPHRIEVSIRTPLSIRASTWYWHRGYYGAVGYWSEELCTPSYGRISPKQAELLSVLVMAHPFLSQFVQEYGISLCES